MASTYKYELSPGQFLFLSNQGTATTVVLSSGGASQQQQSSNGFATGEWTSLPQLYRVGQGAIVVIKTANQTYYVQYQQGQVQMTDQPSAAITSAIASAQPTPMQPTDQLPGLSMPSMAPMPSMPPMSPMPPMQMDNPMSMKLGNMSMSMGDDSTSQSSTSQSSTSQSTEASSQKTKRFCTQCGAPTEPQDKFCGACGNALT